MELSDFEQLGVKPHCIADVAFGFFDPSLVPHPDLAPDKVTIARVEQRNRVENGLGLVAAGFVQAEDAQFEPNAYTPDASDHFARHFNSNNSGREQGDQTWQFVSFMDGSARSTVFVGNLGLAKGVEGESDPVVVVAEVDRWRVGMDSGGEVVIQGGLLFDEVVGAFDIQDIRGIQSSLTDLTDARVHAYPGSDGPHPASWLFD